jgi:hypothetical protein
LSRSAPRRRTTTAKIVEGLSPQVADVVTGGSWSAGKQGGFYRAIVVMTGTEQTFGARIFLQWLGLSEANPVPTVLATVPIKEINDQKLANASIEIEGEESKDISMRTRTSLCSSRVPRPANTPMAKAPAKAPAASLPKGGTKVPKDD